MAVSPLLATVAELGILVKQLSLAENDPYATMILSQASQAVRDKGSAGWVRLEDPEVDEPGPGQTEAPQTAHDITLQVARRAYLDRGNLARRTTGPMSETFFENGVYGLDLTEDEIDRLGKISGASTGGLWVQPTGDDSKHNPIILPDERAGSDPILYAGPEWAWAFEPRA